MTEVCLNIISVITRWYLAHTNKNIQVLLVSALPHLCQYLQDLSQSFSNFAINICNPAIKHVVSYGQFVLQNCLIKQKGQIQLTA